MPDRLTIEEWKTKVSRLLGLSGSLPSCLLPVAGDLYREGYSAYEAALRIAGGTKTKAETTPQGGYVP